MITAGHELYKARLKGRLFEESWKTVILTQFEKNQENLKVKLQFVKKHRAANGVPPKKIWLRICCDPISQPVSLWCENPHQLAGESSRRYLSNFLCWLSILASLDCNRQELDWKIKTNAVNPIKKSTSIRIEIRSRVRIWNRKFNVFFKYWYSRAIN